MAVNLTLQESVTSATEPKAGGSLTWTAGSRGLVCIAAACSGGNPTGYTVTDDGGGTTWSSVATLQVYGSRRAIDVYMSNGTPASGIITVDVAFSGTFTEVQFHVLEMTGQAATPVSAYQPAVTGAGPTSLNTAPVGTIDSGDMVLCFGAFENGADSLALESGTQLGLLNGGSDVRSSIVGKSTTDNTPGITWTTGSYSAAAIGLLIETGAADTTAPTLTSPTGTKTGSTTADGTVSTDEGNGTMYAIVDTSATPPSVAQIQAGNGSGGGAADYSGNQAISTTGTKTFNATGLTASTTYYFYFQHKDAASNDSTVSASTSFLTDAAGGLDFMWRRRWN